MRTTWSFSTAARLVFGPGAVEQLGALVAERGWRRVLVVTDATLEKVGVLDQALRPLREAGIQVESFTGGEPEPSLEVAAAAIAHAQQVAAHSVKSALLERRESAITVAWTWNNSSRMRRPGSWT